MKNVNIFPKQLIAVILITVLSLSLSDVAFALGGNVDTYLTSHGIPSDIVNSASAEEKATFLEAAEAREDIDVNEVDVFLIDRGTPRDIIDNMTFGQKVTIYESLLAQDDCEDIFYVNYNEKIVEIPANQEADSVGTTGIIPPSCLKLSATSFYAGGNLNRYYIYPSFAWINGAVTDVDYDTFSYAIHDDHWNALADGKFNIYYGDFLVNTLSRPSQVGFSARSYKMRSGQYALNGPYNGTACMIARNTTAPIDNRIIINYSQDLIGGLSISFGVFSISVRGATNSAGEEVRF